MKKSRRNYRKRSPQRKTRRRGGSNTPQVEELSNHDVPYMPNTGMFGFKRSSSPTLKRGPKNYECIELYDLLEQSNNYSKMFTNKEKEMIKKTICFPHSDKTIEDARQKVIEIPDESRIRNFIEQLRIFYTRPIKPKVKVSY